MEDRKKCLFVFTRLSMAPHIAYMFSSNSLMGELNCRSEKAISASIDKLR
jgi:hypothetical protein